MPDALELEVQRRASHRREYCLIPQSADLTPHQIDHIIARKHRGATISENLAFSCLHCNAKKGPNIAGLDPDSNMLTRLYHPRDDQWPEHFQLEETGVISGRSAVGRTTLYVLDMNDSDAIALRWLLLQLGEIAPLTR